MTPKTSFMCMYDAQMAAGSGSMHAPNPLLGNILCFCAQLGTATQIVIEEKFMKR